MAIKKILTALLLVSGLVFGQARWYGDQKLNNGVFSSTSNWGKDISWAISGGVANYDAIYNAQTIYQTTANMLTPLVSGKPYKITLTIKATTYARLRFANVAGTVIFSDFVNYPNGTYNIHFTASGIIDGFSVVASNSGGGGACSIDNISIQEVLLSSPIAKSKTNFVTVPPTSLVNEPNCVFAYSGNQPINKTITDISGNGNNGTLNGGVMYAGGLEGGLQFNGTSSYVSVADANSLDFGTGDYTVEVYLQPLSLANTYNTFINKGTSGARSCYGALKSDGAIYFNQNDGTNNQTILTSASIVAVGKKYHIVYSMSKSGNIVLYVNGVAISTTANTVTGSVSNNSNLIFGGLAGEFCKMNLYSAKLYNVALTPTQIKDKWNNIANKPYYINLFDDLTTANYQRDFTRISGSWAINTTTADEGIVKKGTRYLQNTSAGIVAFPSNQAYGRWSFDLWKGADANSIEIQFISNNTAVNSTSSYQLYISSAESFALFKNGVSTLTLTANSYLANSTWYHIDIERTAAGVFSVYITGGAFTTKTLVSTVGGSGTNPVTDATYTTSKWFVLDLDANDRITNIRMYKGIPVQ